MPSAQVIMPKGSVFKPQQIERIIQNTLNALAKDIKVDFDVTTQTWGNRPAVKISTPSQYERTIVPSGDIYPMLDTGTRAHTIKPKKIVIDKRTGKPRKVRLHFKTPFRAKTLPNSISSRSGSIGSTDVYARQVRHPGTKPRNWAKTIAKKWQRQAPIVMQRAISAEYSR